MGNRISQKPPIEAIGLPLKVGDETLGVLTLYREKKGEAVGFLTTEENDLLEIASDIAGLLSVLQSRQAEKWKEGEDKRRQEVYDRINLQNDLIAFEARVCQEALKSFRAVRADFYKVEETDSGEVSLIWMDGFNRDHKMDETTEAKDLPPETLPLVNRVFSDYRDAAPKVYVERHEINKADRENFNLAAREGMVKRACVPLVGEKKLLGILDLHWSISPKQASLLNAQHDGERLRILGEMIGAVYLRRQIKHEAEQSSIAAAASGAYSFQYSHRLGNFVQTAYSLAQSIKEITDEKERDKLIDKLINEMEIAIQNIESVKDHGQGILYQNYKNHSLLYLIKQSMKGIDQDKQKFVAEENIKIVIDVTSDITVCADYELTREAFINILNNGLQAIIDKEKSAHIAATSADNKMITVSVNTTNIARTATIVFADTGIGMDSERIEAAKRGFIDTKGRKGVGVLISKVLLNVQGGDLNYESEKGTGTKAIVTLPLAYKGEKPRVIATYTNNRKEYSYDPTH